MHNEHEVARVFHFRWLELPKRHQETLPGMHFIRGNVDGLQFLDHHNGVGRPYSLNLGVVAAAAGQLEVIKWLDENDFLWFNVLDAARDNHQTAVVEYFKTPFEQRRRLGL
jgi:hypothetical protein